MQKIQQQCVDAYRQHQNLKIAAQHIGISWQSLYVHLRKAGEPVVGNKTVYGSASDKVAASAEVLFERLVPNAENQNKIKFQSKVDFLVNNFSVDVKASTLRKGHANAKHLRWAFSVKKQEAVADFFVCFCLDESGHEAQKLLLIPGEIARKYQSISVSRRSGNSWWEYEIHPDELASFFDALKD